MVYPLIEFGLSEFGTFEFGYEQGSHLVGAALQANGQGTAVFNTLVLNMFETAITGSSQAMFDAQTIKLTTGDTVNGYSSANFEVTLLRNAVMASSSYVDAFFNPSYVIEAAMSGEGFGDFIAIYVDPETFDARGSSFVKFVSGYAFTTNMNSEGEGKFRLDNFAYSDAFTNVAGVSSVTLKPGTWSVASLSSNGVGAMNAPVQIRANSTAQSSGSTTIQMRNQTVKVGKIISDGKAVGSMKTQYAFNSGFNANGSSTLLFRMNAVTVAVMEAIGTSIVSIRPGSPVSEFLPPAWDVVIRPYENRGVIWK